MNRNIATWFKMIKKISLLLLFLSCTAAQGISQRASYKDSIEFTENFFTGMRFYQHDHRLTFTGLSNVMHGNQEALAYLNKAKTNNVVSFIAGFIGGFLIGYELGNSIGGNKINWAVVGTGAGFVVIGIPFDIGARRNARKAVYLYNAAYR